MIADTSKKAYKEINDEGIASSQKDVILKAVQDYNLLHIEKENGLSLREISKFTGYDINAVSGRVNQLKKDLKLKETDKRKCTISGRLINPVRVINNENT